MRELQADIYGIINDEHYLARLKSVDPGSWLAFQPLVNRLKRYLGDSASIVDLGSGEGFLAKCCMENGLKTVALEGSAAAVEWSRVNLGVDARKHNLKERLPFKDSSVDCAVYHDVYEHVPQYINETIFDEVFRVIRKGGFFLVVTICRYDYVEAKEKEHITFTTPTELLRFGKRHGFAGTILMPGFNISLLTPRIYDRDFNVNPFQYKMRSWAKRNYKKINLILSPLILPIFFINKYILHVPVLDLICHKSIVLFKKP
jgi:SAM-dependent methyltransferase